LFVHVEQRLLSTVTAEHGRVYERILGELGQKPEQVVISLPPATGDNAALLVRSALNYKGRGYKIMLQVRDFGDLVRGNLFLAEPNFVQVDLPSEDGAGATARVVQALRRSGTRVLARRIESAAQAELARDLGFDLLQGHYFGSPAATPVGQPGAGTVQ
jgi:EAL and modified HD-GYP domain-containing signal transduction protein